MTIKNIEGSLMMLEVIAENEKEGKTVKKEDVKRHYLYLLKSLL